MASRIFAIASSRVFPCEMQPGKAGHSATNTPSSSGSNVMRNFTSQVYQSLERFATRESLYASKNVVTRLFLGAGVVDLHRLLFLAALIFVPFKHHMVVVGDLQFFAYLCFHSGHSLHFARVRECLGRGIVGAFGELDAGAHVIDP